LRHGGFEFDNAAAEAVNSTIKVELVHRRRFATRATARAEPMDYENLINTIPTTDREDQAA
jgi:hypothetical protein